MTLIIKSDKALTTPLSGNPILANLTKNLFLNFTFDRYRNIFPNGSNVSSVSSDGEMIATLAAKISGMEYPELVHDGPNGHAALEFKGNHMIGMGLANGSSPTILQANEVATFAVVAKTTSASTSAQRIVGVDQNVGFRYIAPQNEGLGLKVASDGGTGELAGKADAWHTLVAVFNGKESKMQLDGGAIKTIVLSNSAFTGMRFGHTGIPSLTPPSAFIGQLAQASIYKRVLSIEEIDALSTSLMTRYGISKPAA